MTLSTLTDRDLMMNLWLTILMLTEGGILDAQECEQTLLRDGQEPQPDAPTITLAELLTETQSRLRLSGGLGSFKQDRTN